MCSALVAGYPSIDKPWLKYYDREAIEGALPECTVWEYVRDANQDNLGAVVLNFYGRDMTYGELFDEVERAASALAALGVKAGDMVTAAMLNTPEAIVLMLALNWLGAAANMVYVTESADEMAAHIEAAGSKVVFALDASLDAALGAAELTGVERVVVVPLTRSMSWANRLGARLKGVRSRRVPDDGRCLSWDGFMALAGGRVVEARDPDAVAFVVYTGGTTGGSKGVMLTSRQVVAVAAQVISAERDIYHDDIWLQILPPFIAYGITFSLVVPLAYNMKLVLRLPMADSISYLCRKFRPNHVVYGPAFWEQFSKDKRKIDLSFLRGAGSGGDGIRPVVERAVNERLKAGNAPNPLLSGYGLTEVGATVTENLHAYHRFGSVGPPLPKTVISAFDPETGEELPCGQEGELCIAGPSLMKGYLGEPGETAAVVRRHVDGLDWLHSGDLGRIDSDGFVFVSGRLKRYLLRIRGGIQKKVFSLDVERVLLENPDVANCAVVPRNDKADNQVPVAFVVPANDRASSDGLAQDLAAYCESALDEWHHPVEYRIVENFPLTKVGKVDYRELERRAAG